MQCKSRGLPIAVIGAVKADSQLCIPWQIISSQVEQFSAWHAEVDKGRQRLNGQSCASLANIAILQGLQPESSAGTHTAITILELTQGADGKGSLHVIPVALRKARLYFRSSDPPAERAKWCCKTNKLKVICSKRNRQG